MAFTTYNGNLTTSATAVTKGTYTQIVAATPADSSRLYLNLGSATSAPRLVLIDLATGAAGSETVVVANLAVHVDSDLLAGTWVPLTLDVPAGSRLAIRAETATAGALTVSWNVLLEDRALGGLVAPVTYGAVPASGFGTTVDPGTTINTKGVYSQLTASTSARIDVLLVCLTVSAPLSTITAFAEWLVDVATGAAGAETVILPDVHLVANTGTDKVRPDVLRVPLTIAAGTRLAVRCQCTVATALQRVLAVTLVGMQEPATAGGGATSVAYLG